MPPAACGCGCRGLRLTGQVDNLGLGLFPMGDQIERSVESVVEFVTVSLLRCCGAIRCSVLET
uniref:Uncharacterized protein n=1 Tax=Oryza nivara TaxID=4536 RepID=A0A0E0HBT4_ORYNI